MRREQRESQAPITQRHNFPFLGITRCKAPDLSRCPRLCSTHMRTGNTQFIAAVARVFCGQYIFASRRPASVFCSSTADTSRADRARRGGRQGTPFQDAASHCLAALDAGCRKAFTSLLALHAAQPAEHPKQQIVICRLLPRSGSKSRSFCSAAPSSSSTQRCSGASGPDCRITAPARAAVARAAALTTSCPLYSSPCLAKLSIH